MTINVFFAAPPRLWPHYRAPLQAAFIAAGLDVALSEEAPDPGMVDYIVFAPGGVIEDFGPYTRAKAVLNLWAGVERIVGNTTLSQPLCRMVDPGLTEGMVEYVTGHVLRYHLNMDDHLFGQDGVWRNGHGYVPPLARERPVGILGLGVLGTAVANALVAMNFPVHGWSRRAKDVPGVMCHAGDTGLDETLSRSEILVTLLPKTPDTENVLNARTLALMPKGARIINPGRGALIDDDALLAALDAGQIGHATLDVFRQEPLPPSHPYWAHPKVTVTPHIAAETRPLTAARVVAENIRRGEAGQPFLHLVDRAAGY